MGERSGVANRFESESTRVSELSPFRRGNRGSLSNNPERVFILCRESPIMTGGR
jgi:hypothetical protein